MAQADIRQAGGAVLHTAGNPLTLYIVDDEDTGYFDGKTWQAELTDGTDLTTAVVGDTMSIVVTAAQSAAVGNNKFYVYLKETTGGANIKRAKILISQGDSSTSSPDATISLRTADSVTLPLTVVTAGVSLADVSDLVDALIAGAPGALDTLNELAAALGDDANFATTVTNALALKANLASPALTGTPTAPTAAANTNTTQVATTAYVQGEITEEVARSDGAYVGVTVASGAGIDPTGVTDSAAAIFALIDSDTHVHFPAGTYLIDSLQGGAAVGRSLLHFEDLENVVITADPDALITTTEEGPSIFEFRDCTNVRISGLRMVGTDSWNGNDNSDIGGSAIRLTSCTRSTVEDCDLSHFGYSVIYLTASCTYCTVRGNRIYDCDNADGAWANGINEDAIAADLGGPGATPYGNVIAENHISNVIGSGGIVLDNNSKKTGTRVVNNIIDAGAGTIVNRQGIRLANVAHCLISGNHISGMNREGIYFDKGIFSGGGGDAELVQIVDNTVEDCGAIGPDPGIYAVNTNDVVRHRGLIISRNLVTGSGLQGIRVDAILGCSIEGNIIRSSGGAGIRYAADGFLCTNLSIRGNIVRDSGAEGITVRQTDASGNLNGYDVSDNIVYNSQRTGIALVQLAADKLVNGRVGGNVVTTSGLETSNTYDSLFIDATRIVVGANVLDGGSATRYGVYVDDKATAYLLDGNSNVSNVSGAIREPAVSAAMAENVYGVKTFLSSPVVPDSSFAIAKTTGLQAALDLKAPAANPVFTGTVTIPDGALAPADVAGLAAALTALDSVFIPIQRFTATTGTPSITNPTGALITGALDQTTDEAYSGVIEPLPHWATCAIDIVWTNLGAGAGNVVWRCQYLSVGDTEDHSTAMTSGGDLTFAAPAQNIEKHTTLATGITVTAGERLVVRVRRLASAGADTVANDVGLIGVRLRKLT